MVKENDDPARIKEALKLIKPSAERRAECERDFDKFVPLIGKMPDRISRAGLRDDMTKLAATLRAVERVGWPWQSPSFIEQVKRERTNVENRLQWFKDVVGSPQKNMKKEAAAHFAHTLLIEFGSRPPALKADGPWHQLADLLFEVATGKEANLFEYLRQHRHPLASLVPYWKQDRK
jgi:hypothetical protein